VTSTTARRRRAACVVGVLPLFVWAVLATPAFHDQMQTPCPVGICPVFERATPQTLAVLDRLGLPLGAYAVAVTGLAWLVFALFTAVAVLLMVYRRRPGPLVPVAAALLALSGIAPLSAALTTHSDTALLLDVARDGAVQVLVPVFFGLFPDGRWHPRWFRWWWPLVAVIGVGEVVGEAIGGEAFLDATAAPLAAGLAFLVLLVFQVHRYRRVSDWAARQQTKWVLAAFVVIVANALLVALVEPLGLITSYQPVAVLLVYLADLALGAGLALALLRYRLGDADVVLRRTALYTGAVVGLAGGYIGLVAAASAVLTSATASAVGAVLVAALALGGAAVAFRLRNRIRGRLLGGEGLAAAVAALARAREPATSDLAETIARGLGLPAAAVLAVDGTRLWEHGRSAGPLHRESIVDADGSELGALVLAPPPGSSRLDRHHRRLLAEVLPFVVLVLRAREEAEQLRAARAAAVSAREDERRRLRRDLHDGVGPLLAGQLLTVDTLRLAAARNLDAAELLAHLDAQARSAITEVRRIAHDLRPAALDAGGVTGALQREGERLSAAGLPVEVDVEGDGVALRAAVEVAVLRIAQEALANVVRHAGASRASVRLRVGEADLELLVTDDGRGRHGAADGAGMGTAWMRDRAEELGGTVEFGRGPGGAGTAVWVRIPL